MRKNATALLLVLVLAGCATQPGWRPRFDHFDPRQPSWGFTPVPRPESLVVVKAEIISVHTKILGEIGGNNGNSQNKVCHQFRLHVVDGKLPGDSSAKEFDYLRFTYESDGAARHFAAGQTLTFLFHPDGVFYGVKEIPPVYPKEFLGGNKPVKNPKLLVPPIKLARAEWYLDGGSLGGTLLDSRGQRLDFLIRNGLDAERIGKIDIGFVSGHRNKSMAATFDGWTKHDLFQIIEIAITQQFVWDPTAESLRAADPNDPVSRELSKIDLRSAEKILHYVQQQISSANKTETTP